MKLKKLVSALVSGAMILGTMAAVPVFADEVTTVSPNWDENSTATVFAYGTNTSGNFALYANTLTDALKRVYMKDPEGTTTIECKPNADVGSMQHGHVADNLIINGNDAYVSGGEYDLEIDTYTFDRTTGTNTASTTPELSGEITVKVNKLNQIAAWGQRRSDATINLEFTDCEDMNRVYFSGNTGTTNITINNCSFSDATGGSSRNTSIYSNAKGAIVLNNVSFANVAVPINLKNKSDDTQNIIVKNCQFTNCATAEIAAQTSSTLYAAPIRVVTEGSAKASNVTVENCSFTGCATAGNGTILLGDGRDGENSTPNVTLNISGTAAEIQVQEPGKRTTPTVKRTVTAADNEVVEMPAIAKINDKKYSTLKDAVAAAQNGNTVTLLSDASGDGVAIMEAEAKNITIDLGGNTYTVSGGAVGSTNYETQGFHLEKGSNITIKNGTITSTANSGVLLLVQNYCNLTLDGVTLDGTNLRTPSGWPCGYVMSNNCGNTVLQGNTNIIAKAGDVAFDSCEFGSYPIPTVTVETTGTINGNIELTGGNIIVKSGTFTSDVAKYVADGYYQKDNGNGTYTVLPVEAKVIDTAKTTGATVTLDNLNKNTVVDPAADATYKVVVSTPAAADADAVNEAIEDSKATSTPDNNTSKAMFDISVVKVDSNGVETDLGGTNTGSITNQPVTLTLGETPVVNSKVFVYHVDDLGNATKVATVTADGTNKVTFTAPSFSTYAITYTPVAPTEAASKVGVVFSPVSQGSNQYYINLKSLDGKPINRFMSTDLVFKNGCSTVDYDITPATSVTASVVSENGASREYRFNMDGKTLSSATGTGITIGTITFYGYGTLDFSVDTLYSSGHAINIVNTAKIANNIVDNYMVSGGTLLVNDSVTGNSYLADDEKGTIKNVTLAPETKDLTVNIAYNNKINNNAAAYQDMTVTISGGDLTTPIVKHLGSEGYTLTDNVYTVTVANELTQNVAYTVTVEGAGYRTARYTVNMTADKTLNFWNNVMDENNKQVIEVGAREEDKVTKNFLAGDIVKDNNINIYDLSAVVSYFGENNLVTAHPEYAKYDLNRDGVIDSKDVAYVLVSWGK